MTEHATDDLDATTRALLERAMQQLRTRQVAAATAILQQVLQRAPDQPAALQLLGVPAFQSGRSDVRPSPSSSATARCGAARRCR